MKKKKIVKRNHYVSCLNSTLKIFNQIRNYKESKDLSYEDQLDILMRILFQGNDFSNPILQSHMSLWAEGLEKVMNNEIKYLFINSLSLVDFLKSIELIDLENIYAFINENGEFDIIKPSFKADGHGEYVEYKNPQSIIASTIYYGILLPNKLSYYIRITLDENNVIRLVLIDSNNYIMTADSKTIDKLKNGDELDKQDYELFKLAVNMLFYCQAFPECVSEGLPKDSVLDSYPGLVTQKNNVSLSDKIIEKTTRTERGEVIPHFRRGHFRYLGSERFTKMRGKTIFIESTFVKGKDLKKYTVEDTSKKEEMGDIKYYG